MKPSPSSGTEGAVDDVEDLRLGAEVDREAADAPGRQRRPAVAEDPHVGVPEAVDRLGLVADREQVVALERLEHVELQPVRVLELVDHDQREALGPAGARRGVGASRSRTRSSRSSKSTAARAALAAAYAAEKRASRSSSSGEGGPGVEVGAGGAVGRPGLAVGDAVVVLERLRAGGELRVLQRGRERDAVRRPRGAPRSRARASACCTRTPAAAPSSARAAAAGGRGERRPGRAARPAGGSVEPRRAMPRLRSAAWAVAISCSRSQP